MSKSGPTITSTQKSTQSSSEEKLAEIKSVLQEHGSKEEKIATHTEKLIHHTQKIIEEKHPEETFERIRQHFREMTEMFSEQKEAHEILWGEEQINELRDVTNSFRSASLALARNRKFRSEFKETLNTLQLLVADLTKSGVEKKHSGEDILPRKEEFVSIIPTAKLLSPSLVQGYREYRQHEVSSHFERSKINLRQKLRELLVQLGQCTEYKNFVQSLFTFFEHNNKRLRFDYAQGNEKFQQPFKLLFDDLQQLFEKFSSGKSLTPLRSRISNVWKEIRTNKEISSFFGAFRNLVTETLEKPEKQDLHKLDQQVNSFYERARLILQKKNFREDLVFILSEMRHVLKRFREDTHVRNITSDVQELRKEILLNKQGDVDLQVLRESLPALRRVLVPTITTSIGAISIPPIRSDTEKYLFEATNLHFTATDLLPESLKIKLNNLVTFDFSGVEMDRLDSVLLVSLKDFHAHLQDINFHYERKSVPVIRDSGIVNVEVSGTTVKIVWKIQYDDGKLQFFLEKVRCFMADLNITVKKAHHSILDKLVVRYFNTTIKNRMLQSIEETLSEKLKNISIDTKRTFEQLNPAE